MKVIWGQSDEIKRNERWYHFDLRPKYRLGRVTCETFRRTRICRWSHSYKMKVISFTTSAGELLFRKWCHIRHAIINVTRTGRRFIHNSHQEVDSFTRKKIHQGFLCLIQFNPIATFRLIQRNNYQTDFDIEPSRISRVSITLALISLTRPLEHSLLKLWCHEWLMEKKSINRQYLNAVAMKTTPAISLTDGHSIRGGDCFLFIDGSNHWVYDCIT